MRTQSDLRLLILTVTASLCVLVWGSMIVNRTVVDRNYHPPLPQSATQQRMKAYTDCVGVNAPTKSADCRALAEQK